MILLVTVVLILLLYDVTGNMNKRSDGDETESSSVVKRWWKTNFSSGTSGNSGFYSAKLYLSISQRHRVLSCFVFLFLDAHIHKVGESYFIRLLVWQCRSSV